MTKLKRANALLKKYKLRGAAFWLATFAFLWLMLATGMLAPLLAALGGAVAAALAPIIGLVAVLAFLVVILKMLGRK